eukprot:8810610-Karenia_brevis.AAC.1
MRNQPKKKQPSLESAKKPGSSGMHPKSGRAGISPKKTAGEERHAAERTRATVKGASCSCERKRL